MSAEPHYDGGKYCVEHLVEGRWKKKKTGSWPSRNWNHITLAYATHQFERQTLLGEAARIVYEPTNRVVIDNEQIHTSDAWRAWKYSFLVPALEYVKKREGNRE